jgi:hypothetical protein
VQSAKRADELRLPVGTGVWICYWIWHYATVCYFDPDPPFGGCFIGKIAEDFTAEQIATEIYDLDVDVVRRILAFARAP